MELALVSRYYENKPEIGEWISSKDFQQVIRPLSRISDTYDVGYEQGLLRILCLGELFNQKPSDCSLTSFFPSKIPDFS